MQTGHFQNKSNKITVFAAMTPYRIACHKGSHYFGLLSKLFSKQFILGPSMEVDILVGTGTSRITAF
jgi:hypothetical protein